MRAGQPEGELGTWLVGTLLPHSAELTRHVQRQAGRALNCELAGGTCEVTVILYLRNSASELLTVEVVLTPPGFLFDGRSTAFRGGTSFIAMQSV